MDSYVSCGLPQSQSVSLNISNPDFLSLNSIDPTGALPAAKKRDADPSPGIARGKAGENAHRTAPSRFGSSGTLIRVFVSSASCGGGGGPSCHGLPRTKSFSSG